MKTKTIKIFVILFLCSVFSFLCAILFRSLSESWVSLIAGAAVSVLGGLTITYFLARGIK